MELNELTNGAESSKLTNYNFAENDLVSVHLSNASRIVSGAKFAQTNTREFDGSGSNGEMRPNMYMVNTGIRNLPNLTIEFSAGRNASRMGGAAGKNIDLKNWFDILLNAAYNDEESTLVELDDIFFFLYVDRPNDKNMFMGTYVNSLACRIFSP